MEQQNSLPQLPKTFDIRIARWVSNGFNPIVLIIVMILIIAASISASSAWIWASIQIASNVLLPVFFILWLLKNDKVSDFDVYHRKQRLYPYIFIIGCNLLLLALMILFKAPVMLTLLGISAAVLILIMFLINLIWKISAHSATMGSFVTVLLYMFGIGAWYSVFLIPIMIWSRVRLKRHTFWQTIAGTILGISIVSSALYLSGNL